MIIGVVGGALGVIINANFIENPDFGNFDILVGLLSHTVMNFGLYCIIGFKLERIRVFSMLKSSAIGMMIWIIFGCIHMIIVKLTEVPYQNSMFMLEGPFPELPFINFYTILVFTFIIIFGISAIVELIALPKEERWYKIYLEKKE